MNGNFHTVMTIRDEMERSASWWRAAGFPVPPGVPDNALGRLTDKHTVSFSWNTFETELANTLDPKKAKG